MPNDAQRSKFQAKFKVSAFALGPNGNKLLNEQFSAEEAPVESDRRLEVALLWGDTVIDMRSYPPGHPVRIGHQATADFRIYDDGLPPIFDLVADDAVHVPSGSTIVTYRGGRESPGSGPGPLALTDRALVTIGTTHFIVRWIRPAARSKTGLFDTADFYFTKVLSAAFLIHLVLFVGFWITPLSSDLLSEELFKGSSTLVQTLIKPAERKRHEISGMTEGSKPVDREGKLGRLVAKKPEAAPSKPGGPLVDARKREADRRRIMSAGLLAGLQEAAATVFGPGGLGTGLNIALGGLKGGAQSGDAQGIGGLGSRGDGPGGGGSALGIGGLGTHGAGRGRGGYGNVELGGTGKHVTQVIPGHTRVQGSLSKDVIADIVRKHQNEIKYCYEVELNKHPDLNGKVSVAWTIDGAGDVSEANVNETTIGNANVENCMATKIRRWKFPEPRGGGQVFVTYPWVFHAAGSEE